jgi:hypothetical protein
MFRSRKTDKIKYVAIGEIKDWRDAGYEIDHIGIRLDQARAAAKQAKTKWAKDYWETTAARLLTKWHLTISLKDSGLRQQGRESFYNDIDYYWWEGSDEVANILHFGVFERLTGDIGLQARLEESWERSREQKLQKARQGLA